MNRIIISGLLLAASLSAQSALTFTTDYSIVKDNAQQVKVALKLSQASANPVTVSINTITAGTAVAGTHYTYANADKTIAAGLTADTLTIPVSVVAGEKSDVYFALTLANPQNATLGSTKTHIVYIRKDTLQAPKATDSLSMKHIASYAVDKSLLKDSTGGSAEIVAYHAGSKRLFVLNSIKASVFILDFSNPRAIVTLDTVDMTAYGIGATSVAVKGDYIAATVDRGPKTNGKLVLMDKDGSVKSVLTVGSLPDMVTFTPDGKWVMTANEGQPSVDYATDMEGSVSMVDVSAGIVGITDDKVHTVGFSSFNAKKDSLKALGLRVFGKNQTGSTLAQDMEPEFITVSADSKKAWVTLQENNAIAELDLETKTFTSIRPLGMKNFAIAGNEFDASDKTSEPAFVNWPVYGLYMPDAIANYKVGADQFLVTANEGDAREYGTYLEEAKVKDATYVLDATVFPQGSILKSEKALGRLAVTKESGDTDGDGDYDQICAFGARSFTIWNATTGASVYDSKSDFERITAKDATYGKLFNVSNDNSTLKNRSDNKGPEPEGIALGVVRDRTYAFITLERIGGVITYDVTSPTAPVFVSYVNSRNLDSTDGDLGPEGIIFIDGNSSPNDTALVVVANEISATLSIFQVNEVKTASTRMQQGRRSSIRWELSANTLILSKPTSVQLYDAMGNLRVNTGLSAWVGLDHLPAGSYWAKLGDGSQFGIQLK